MRILVKIRSVYAFSASMKACGRVALFVFEPAIVVDDLCAEVIVGHGIRLDPGGGGNVNPPRLRMDCAKQVCDSDRGKGM